MRLIGVLMGLSAALAAMFSTEISLLAGAEPQAASMETVWAAIDPMARKDVDRCKAMSVPFRLGSPEVDAFFLGRLGQYSDYKVGGREEMDRIVVVMKGNAEGGCLWRIAHGRNFSLSEINAAVVAMFSCSEYQEDYQFLAGLLGDTRVFLWEQGPQLAPFAVYRTRMCDRAYGSLFHRFAPCARLATLARQKGWEWPPKGVPGRMPYEERDRQIGQLVELLKTPAAREYVASRPSALAVVTASGEMPDIVQAARRSLSVSRPQMIKPPLPGATMMDVLENEYPPLSEKEKALRQLVPMRWTVSSME